MGDRICTSAVWGEVNWRAPDILAEDRHEDAAEHLVKYFGPDETGNRGAYSGADFNELGGGGDQASTADVITGEDIVSLRLLSVTPPTLHSMQLLGVGVTEEGIREVSTWRAGLDYDKRMMKADIPSIMEVPIDAAAVNEALSRVPKNRALAEIPSEDIDDILRAVEILWREVRRSHMGTTMVSKLLARKRPGLLPVIDGFIRKQLTHGNNRTDFYKSMWRVMSDRELDLPGHLQSVRNAALNATGDQRIGRLSDLRVFDVVVWREEERIRKPQFSS